MTLSAVKQPCPIWLPADMVWWCTLIVFAYCIFFRCESAATWDHVSGSGARLPWQSLAPICMASIAGLAIHLRTDHGSIPTLSCSPSAVSSTLLLRFVNFQRR